MFSQSHKIASYMKINLISKPCWLTERIVLSDTNCNHGSDFGHASYMVKTILPNWDGGFSEQIVPLSHNRDSGLKGSVVYESRLSFRENKNGRRLQKVAENGVELKPIVFALFSQNEKSAT